MVCKRMSRFAFTGIIIVCLAMFLAACSAPVAKESPSPPKPSTTTQSPSPPKPSTESPSPPKPSTITVYITKTGEKYHRAGCRYLSKSMIPIALESAKARGYTPCSVCKPPW